MVSRVSNVWLPVQDMDRAVAFYRDVLGLEVQMQSPEWTELDASGLSIGLNAREPRGATADGGAVITFTAEDIDGEMERLQDRGTEFTGGVSSYDWGRVAPFKDSEGNDLQLYAPPVD
jgi:predicted enzyme related to lactoylglutathione lyase